MIETEMGRERFGPYAHAGGGASRRVRDRRQEQKPVVLRFCGWWMVIQNQIVRAVDARRRDGLSLKAAQR